MKNFCKKIIFLSLLSVQLLHAAPALISLNLQAVPLNTVLQIIADQTKRNFLINEQLTQPVTLKVEQITADELLELLAQRYHLTVTATTNNNLIIDPPQENSNYQPRVITKTFSVKQLTVTELAQTLKDAGLISTHGKLGINSSTNTLTITDHPEHVLKSERLIAQLDRIKPQVFLAAQIVNVDQAFMRELGIEFTNTSTSENLLPNEFSFTLAKLKQQRSLELQLQTLEKNGRGKIISQPKLLAAHQQTAYIETGMEIPYQEKTKGGNTSVHFKKAALSLKITPQITTTNTINLTLELHQDQLGSLMINGTPAINTRQIQTTITARNHETIVLGGIYEWQRIKQRNGIPILNKIPLLKWLVSSEVTKLERRELLIFITPHLVKT